MAFIRDSSYIFDSVVIVLGALALISGLAELWSGRLPYPDAFVQLRRQVPATAEDVRLEGLVILLRGAALVVLGIDIFMWHLLIGQRPDQTLQVVFWIANVTVLITGGVLVRAAELAGKKRHYVPRRQTKESAARRGI